MHKENMLHIYSGILLSLKKEQNWIIYKYVDEPGVCHYSEVRNKYHMWNLEKWYKWTYLQGRNKDTDEEIRQVRTGRG